jgi:peptidoglycan/LPS O-acetylase OafA/YrhL
MNSIKTKNVSGDEATYLGYVDGLRAVAILAVVAFHSGVKVVHGGFVGVDIFFVISGYLIIGQIVKGLQSDRFSFAEFWSRRALRILPPYLLVIVASCVIAFFVLVTPEEITDFGKEVLWSAGMVVNHLFLAQEGYFDRTADVKPLLHLWSLAVEEQFYVVAPIALFLGYQLLRRFRETVRRWLAATAIVALMIASFWLCAAYTRGEVNYAFYLMPLRAWEFIAGGLVPVLVVVLRRAPRPIIEVIALVGLALMAYAIFLFRSDRPFPSTVAAIPVAGAVLTIASGLVRTTIVSLVLALPPIRYIGRVSYAWYLWHWPAIVFVSIYAFGRPSKLEIAGAVLVSLLLAIATHHAMERPIYRHRAEWSRRNWRPAIAGLAGAAVVALASFTLVGPIAREVDISIPASFIAENKGGGGELECGVRLGKDLSKCLAAGSGPVGLLWGDSHAKAADYALREYLVGRGVPLVSATVTGCVGFVGFVVFNPDAERVRMCAARWDEAQLALTQGNFRPAFAVLILRHQEQGRIGRWGDPAPYADQNAVYLDGFASTVTFMEKLGVQRILVLGFTPEFPADPTDCVIRADKYGVDRDLNCSKRRKLFDRAHKTIMAKLGPAVAAHPEMRLIDPAEELCGPQWCRPYDGDTVLYKDDDHFGDDLFRRLIAKYPADFAWVVEGVQRP